MLWLSQTILKQFLPSGTLSRQDNYLAALTDKEKSKEENSDAATILSPSMERVVGIGNSELPPKIYRALNPFIGGIFITVTVVLMLWITKFWLRKLRMWCPVGKKTQKYTAPVDDLEAGYHMKQMAAAPFSASPSKYAKRMPRIVKTGRYMRGGVIGGKQSHDKNRILIRCLGLSMALATKAHTSAKTSSVIIEEVDSEVPKRMPRRSSPHKLSMLVASRKAPARPPKSWVDASSGCAPEEQNNLQNG